MRKPYGSFDPLTGEIKLTEIGLQQFWQKVNKDGPVCIHQTLGNIGQCWIWTGSHNQKGYGQFKVGGKNLQSHRISWTIRHGPIRGGLWVCHHCDTPLCQRPDHYFLGTRQDDINDMVQKRRHNLGERNGGCKIKEADVLTIRARVASGEKPAAIAADYVICEGTVWDIARRDSWKHLT